MADSAMKLTVRINDIRGGWSESYYLGPLSIGGPKSTAAAFVLFRAAVLGSGCTIVRVTIGDTAKPRVRLNFKFNANGDAQDISGNEKGRVRLADQRDTCALLPYRTAAGTLRYVTLGGFPDGWLDRATSNEDFQLTGPGQTAVQVFYDYMVKTPGNLHIRERLRTDSFAPKNVTNMAENVDGKYRVTTELPHAFKSGDKVVLTGLRGTNLGNAHGTRKVCDSLSDTTFTIDRGPRADLPDVALSINAQVSKAGYSYEPALESFEGFTASTRRRGRGFAARRGRRSESK